LRDSSAVDELHRQPPGAEAFHGKHMPVVQAVSEVEFTPQPSQFDKFAVIVIKHLERDDVFGVGVGVGAIHRGRPAAAAHLVDDVAVEILSGAQHVISLGGGCADRGAGHLRSP
jgi:hypothetical protein